MGMDVHGKNPTTKDGEYLRQSVWGWRPLADYACKVAPNITDRCRYWQTNDGDGLNARDARRLGERLQEEIDAGRTQLYAERYHAAQCALPDEDCEVCAGTGKRKQVPQTGAGTEPCNGCNSTGKRRPWETYYPFEVEYVQEFATFLKVCGGFEIW